MSLATENLGQALYALFHTAAVDPSTWTKPLDYDAPLSTVDDGSAAYLRWTVRRRRHRSDAVLSVAVIPAFDEARDVPAQVHGLTAQDVPPDLIVVAASHHVEEQQCGDLGTGVVVFVAEPNAAHAAGALNMALEVIVPELNPDDSVMISAADTQPSANFLRQARAVIRDEQRIGRVGGGYQVGEAGSVLGTLQRIECHQYDRVMSHRRHRTSDFDKSCAVFTVDSLRSVRSARRKADAGTADGLRPQASYYSPESWREDDELLLALLTLGYACPCQPTIHSRAVAAESLRDLMRRRRRSYRGTLQNAHAHWRFSSAPLAWAYFAQQAGVMATLFPLAVYLVFTVVLVAVSGLTVGVVAAVSVLSFSVVQAERITAVWALGWRARVLAALGVDVLYSLYLTGLFLVCSLEWTVSERRLGHRRRAQPSS